MGGRGVVIIKSFGIAQDFFENCVPFERIHKFRIRECVILILTANKIGKNWRERHPARDRKGLFFLLEGAVEAKARETGWWSGQTAKKSAR